MSNQKRSRKDNASGGSPIKRRRHDSDIPVRLSLPAVFSLSDVYHVCVYKADITRLAFGAIVNLTDKRLEHKRGLAQAISKAAGPKLARECEEIIKKKRRIMRTEVVSTVPGNLPCKRVIHAVGPKWRFFSRQTNKDYCRQLELTFWNALKCADSLKYKTIALSPRSADFNGLKDEQVADAIYKGIIRYHDEPPPRTLYAIHVVDTEDGVLNLVFDLLCRSRHFKPAHNPELARQLDVPAPLRPREPLKNTEVKVPHRLPPKIPTVNTEAKIRPPVPPKPKISKQQGDLSRAVKVDDFAAYVQYVHANGDRKFKQEYQELTNVGMDQSCKVAKFTSNTTKNRYKNIIPYDHSRVKLLPWSDEESISHYINASWMPGYNSNKEFIVCQGPKAETRNDFWRMIWEYNCRTVIMLTKCIEMAKAKCDHYWPHKIKEPMLYEDIRVEIVSQDGDLANSGQEYITTIMDVSKGKQTRRLTHYLYIRWPDYSTPEVKSIANFVKKMRSMIIHTNVPTVVHCSAGVGRSGTYIALDRLFQTIRVHDAVDIYQLVHEMRRYRMQMVQTEEQYVFIHDCLKYEIERSRKKSGGPGRR